MRKVTKWILFAAALWIVLAVTAGIIYERAEVFEGSRTRNTDSYEADFSYMHQTDSHGMELKAGDSLTVEFAVESGSADLTIAMDGEQPIYRGDDIASGLFTLTVPKDGLYRITLQGRHAKGFVHIHTP